MTNVADQEKKVTSSRDDDKRQPLVPQHMHSVATSHPVQHRIIMCNDIQLKTLIKVKDIRCMCTSLPVFYVRNILTIESAAPLITNSGVDQSTSKTLPLCPIRSYSGALGDRMSQSLTELSYEPETNRL